jgi:hypothetical protein
VKIVKIVKNVKIVKRVSVVVIGIKTGISNTKYMKK